MRAILCYINLVRWNTLQSKILAVTLGMHERGEADHAVQRQRELRETIDTLYVGWHSPISRKLQILANLKLGFSLLFALSLFFLAWGAFALWDRHLVQGLVVFAIGNTLVEGGDFLRSRYFDTKEAWEKARAGKRGWQRIFPLPESPPTYFLTWAGVLLTSLVVSFRGQIAAVGMTWWKALISCAYFPGR